MGHHHHLRLLFNILTTLAVIAALMFAWVILPSSLFLRPVSWQYDLTAEKVTFQRIVNWPGPIDVRWAHTIYVDGKICSSTSGQRRFASTTTVDTIGLPSGFDACLHQVPAVAYLSWSVLAFGVIPLRPVTLLVPPDGVLPR